MVLIKTRSVNVLFLCALMYFAGCSSNDSKKTGVTSNTDYLNPPLVTHLYTADPSAHLFNGRIYIYPSHDIETEAELGGADQFAMRDYHVFSLGKLGDPVVDHGVALDIADVAWAQKQFWAPDAAERDGEFYLYFPAKDKDGIFRIGVAKSNSPEGPFTAEAQPIAGAISIDPSVFQDANDYYLYTGGIWGGQLQRWQNGRYVEDDQYPADHQPALTPKIAKLNADMVTLSEPMRDVMILDGDGKPLTQGDNARRFFEAAWVHKYNGIYYLSYSTGDTHYIRYATSESPYGPFTYQGTVLAPVQGWTNHHSIVEFNGRWFLFYHDSQLSAGKTHLRNIKMVEIQHDANGRIIPVDAYLGDDVTVN